MRLLKALPVRRRKSLLKLIPVAALTGLVDVIVVGIVSRLFTVFIGQPNQPPLPFQTFIPEDPKTKVISLVVVYIAMNWLASFSKLFLQHNIKTKVETGTVVLFPTAWTHLHRGNIATNGYAKYMLGSFLQYAQKQDMDRIGYKTMGLDKKGFG